MKYYKIGYTLPINGYGTKIGLSWSYMDYEIGKELAHLGIEGESKIWSLYFSHPLIRARSENLSLFGSLNLKDMKNYLFEKTYTSSKDKYTTLEIGLNRDKLIKNQHIYWTGKATIGLGEFLGGMSDEEYTGSSRPGLADGTWVKLNFDLTDIFDLGKVKFIVRGSGQISSDNLVTGEQMVLGGADSVRGYPTGEFLGDYGYFLSAELRTPILPGESFLNKYANWAFFIDHGAVYKHTSLPGEDERESATGIGAGFRVYIPCHFHLRFDAARRIGGDEASDKDDWRYWLEAVLNF
jgi:hemolysin activation/secretion protein